MKDITLICEINLFNSYAYADEHILYVWEECIIITNTQQKYFCIMSIVKKHYFDNL